MSTKGWYSQKVGKKNVRLVVLNTEYYDYGNDVVQQGLTVEDGYAQFDWLTETLTAARANNETVYLYGHISPGYEIGYANDLVTQPEAIYRPFMPQLFARAYTDVTDQFQDIIKIQIAGHEHTDTFRISGEKSFLTTSPSMSTAYPTSNPTIRLWKTEEDGDVNDYDQYHFDLLKSNKEHVPYWSKSYTFR
mgnify:CR=1 FL=1